MTQFSVVIPNFNSGEYLRRALQSVLDQTNSNWEVIIVDNNSTDESRDVASIICDSRITQVQIDNQGVIAKSRNLGIRLAKGNFIAFLDADDWWYPTKLSVMAEIIHDKECDFIYHQLRRQPYRKWLRPSIGNQYPNPGGAVITMGNRIPNSSVVAKKSLIISIKGIDESVNLIAVEDFDLWIRLTSAGAKVHFVNRILGCYQESPLSSNNSDRRVFSGMALLEKHGVSDLPGWLRIAIELGRVKMIDGLSSARTTVDLNSFTRRSDVFLYLVLVIRKTIRNIFNIH
jgi:glycosyltransferase involved in cell wall biosynthesis